VPRVRVWYLQETPRAAEYIPPLGFLRLRVGFAKRSQQFAQDDTHSNCLPLVSGSRVATRHDSRKDTPHK